jgi:RHS repeat-associated protein
MDKHVRFLAALALLITGTSTVLAATVVGRTPGAANVDDSGEATYSIPIFAPPGTLGITPHLGFVYGHRNDNTLLGAGWSISGLSAITRCPKIWAADGEMRDVRNDASDRFCLDGNKLRLVSGTYGSAGATYQTEIETFSRITSNGVAGNGPQYFIVERKDGLVYEYGNTEDSRIQSVAQTTARTWALNKVRDRSGNAITFTYFEDTTNGGYRIDLVQYTSNSTQGLSPAYEVDFVWETKPSNEIDSGYIAGSIVKQITRLDRVDVKYNTSTLVRRYELTYEAALSSTSKSRLASLQECAGATPDCFAATTFTYQNGTSGLNAQVSTGATVPTSPLPMDVNGDGREDLVYSSSTTSGSGTWMVMFANGTGYNTPTNTGIANTNYSGAIQIDYNADGLKDLLVPYSGGTWWAMLGSTSGLAAPFNTNAPATGTGGNAGALDINGDGLDDLIWADLVGYAGGDTIKYRLRESAGAFSSTATTLAGPLAVDQKMESGIFGRYLPNSQRFPDFNGDGRGDFLYRRTTRTWDGEFQQYRFTRAIIVHATGTWTSQVGTTANAAGDVSFGDFNGDGKTDIVYLAQTGGLHARFSTGTGLTTTAVPLGGGLEYWLSLDWDGDGFDDLLDSSSGNWILRRSTGEGFAGGVATGIASNGTTVTDLNGDGLFDLTNGATYRTRAGNFPDLLLTATDGFDNFSTFSYASLANYGLYFKQSGAAFPMQEYKGPLYVVSNVANSNGIGGTYNLQSFYYEGARLHRQGRGFLGFSFRSWIDSRDGTAQRRSYRQDFPYIGAVFNARRTQEPSGTSITQVLTTYSTHSYGSGFETRSLPFRSTIETSEREVGGTFNGALVRTTTQQILVDSATGTPYDVTTTTTEPASGANGIQPGASYVRRVYTPTASFSNTPSTWCIGRPGQAQQINSHNQFGGGSTTRTTDITWDTTACRPTQIVEETGNSLLQVTRTLGYDGFGNVNSDSVTGIGMTARTTTTNWGTTGQFPTSVTNALSQTTNKTWNYAFGTQASETDPNGIVVSWLFDDFGRMRRENRPDGTATTRTFNACAAPSYCGYTALRYYIETSLLNTAAAVVRNDQQFFDMLDRLRFDEPLLVTGTRAQTAIAYDALGRVASRSSPRFAAGTLFLSQFSYDLRNRVTQASRPTSDSNPALVSVNTYYEGLTTRVVDALGKQTTRIANAVDGLARSIDHDGYSQTFDYNAFGNPVRVIDSLGNTLQSNTFNIRGVRTAQNDMSAGNWSFIPNALGETTSQTDAKSQTTTFGYDLLGRMTSRVEPEGTSTFTFGTSAAAKNIGQLAGMSGPGYSEGYSYDSSGRLQQRSITSDATYSIDYTYNNQGMLDTLTYPVSTSSYRLKLQYEYQSGQLLRVRDFNAPSTVFWQANSADPWGQVIDETLGNGVQTLRGFDLVTGRIDFIQSGASGSIQNLNYTWDAVGNLTQRQDVRQSLTENFTYDNLHRLTGATGPDPLTIGYDPRGNITSRTGNVSAAATHTITWYSYNLPNTVSATGSQSSQFFYGPDRTRWKQVASYAGTAEQTIYIGGLVEKVTLGTVTSWRHYIAGTTGTVAIYTRKSNGTNELFYLTRDHLDSVDSVTSASGAVVVRLSFGALGQRRNEDTWSGNPTSGDWTGVTNTTRRGFTSHEMLDNLNLTHMNGRVYDQLIGQFTSADPFIDGAGNTQGWNRYSYVHGHPLSSWDPSGYTETIKSCQNCDQLPPGAVGDVIETVNVTATRLSFESGAALHSPDIRMGTPDFGAAGGGGGLPEGVIEEVVTVATRIRPGGSLAVTPGVTASPKCNKLINAGNALARLSKKAGDASTGLIVGGAAVAAIGALGGQPQVTAAGAGAVHTGGRLGMAAGLAQGAAGLLQGWGGGGYQNLQSALAVGSVGGAARLASGGMPFVDARALSATQRAIHQQLHNNATVVGGSYDLLINMWDALGPQEVGCAQ